MISAMSGRLHLIAITTGLFIGLSIGRTRAQETWRDPSPHKVVFVEVQPGIHLEVLDWGGAGETIFLLSGHGDTGHVFDDFAPLLTKH